MTGLRIRRVSLAPARNLDDRSESSLPRLYARLVECNLSIAEPTQELLHLGAFGELEDGMFIEDFLVERLRRVLRGDDGVLELGKKNMSSTTTRHEESCSPP